MLFNCFYSDGFSHIMKKFYLIKCDPHIYTMDHSNVIAFNQKEDSGGSDFRLYDGSDLKTYLLMRW